VKSIDPPASKVKKLDPLIGSVVNGQYRIRSLVAAGGMGKIYEAEQIALGRRVALKLLHTQSERDGDDDPQFKKRFLREASILARLQHPNIVTVFDYGQIEGGESERYFISMEFCAGETLAQRIADRGSLSTKETVRISRQIARGLTEAHAHGVIHRDLKPSNVMLLPGRDGEELVKIVDFGIVKIIGDDSQEKEEELTQEGSFVGSPKYMAPEQINRGGKVDARTDVYSFGIILYQCVTGTVPFESESSVQTLMAHVNEPPQPMRERAPRAEIPDWLDELVMACLEKAPEKRPQTMDAVAKTLAEAEAALASNHLFGSMALRDSSPTQSVAVPPSPAPSRAVSGAVVTGGSTTQGTFSPVRGVDGSEKTRESPGIKKEGTKPRPRMVGAIVAAAVLFLGAGAFIGLHRPEPVTHGAPIVLPPVSAPAPRSHFTLWIESSPTGAEVREGERVLGTTPLELPIDNDPVRRAPRAFVVAKEGFVPYAIDQGPAEEDIHRVALLVAASTAPAPSASAPPRGAPAAPEGRRSAGRATAPSAVPASPHPDLDIRMTR
jgi:eukaryotic-like serine/threonine-protein kinase